MTLKQLGYFLVIAETESITKSAELLHISQPPLSLQLKALEEELGVPLFVRDKKGLTITKAGRLLQQRAQEILDFVNQTAAEVRGESDTPQAYIRIGTINSVSSRILPSRIYAYWQTHPNVDIQVSEASTTDILDLLNDRKIDIGIIREPFNMRRYNYLQVYDAALHDGITDTFVALADPKFFGEREGTDIPLADLKGMPILLHRRFIAMFTACCEQVGFTPDITCKNNDFMALLNWAKAGIGVAVLPYTSAIVSTYPHLIQKSIVDPVIPSGIFLVWNKDTVLTPPVLDFVYLLSTSCDEKDA